MKTSIPSTPTSQLKQLASGGSLLGVCKFAVLLVALAMIADVTSATIREIHRRQSDQDLLKLLEEVRDKARAECQVEEFYRSTIYKPGDFPTAGYHKPIGGLWTPEEGGPCFDSAGNPLDVRSHKRESDRIRQAPQL